MQADRLILAQQSHVHQLTVRRLEGRAARIRSVQCPHARLQEATEGPVEVSDTSRLPAAPSTDPDPWQNSTRLKWQAQPVARIQAGPDMPPIVILPGFGNCSQDYVQGLGIASNSLLGNLQERGFRAHTVEVKRSDWLQALRGLFSRSYWQQKSEPGACYGWYLRKVQRAVNEAREQTGHDQVILVGHSAGGWLARAFMADPLYFESPSYDPGAPHQGVAHLVTLGTPHIAPASEVARDMTGGALTWVNRSYPGAYFMEKHGVQYTCAAGRTVRGDRKGGRRSLERYSHSSYAQVCGQGHGVAGDGVVPLQSATLQGAKNVILDGVYHSMSQVGSFSEPSAHVWYGSDSVVDHWLCHVVSALSSSASHIQ